MTPDLTVIVVTHDRAELAVRVLQAARDAVGGLEVQWLVVDSGSTDDTPCAIERAFADIAVTRRPNIGFAAASNIALAHAAGRYVLLLNPDMEIVDGTLQELVTVLDERPEIGVASVLQELPDGTLDATIQRFPSPGRQLAEALMLQRLPGCGRLGEEDHRPRSYSAERSADWLLGGLLLVRREAIEQIGGLDERFFLFAEETDWCRRLRDAGWGVRYLPIMRATHHTGRWRRPDLYAQTSHSKLLYARKHFGLPARVVFHAALALRHGLRLTGYAVLALLRRGSSQRLAAERRALLVVLGLAPPPFRPAAASSARDEVAVRPE